jgi:hypothetical protein
MIVRPLLEEFDAVALAWTLVPSYVGDRESDTLDLMVRARDQEHRADYLLRSQHDRALPHGAKLWGKVLAEAPLGELRFALPPAKGRKSRPVRQQVRAKRVVLSDRRSRQLVVTCLIATEIDPPPGEKRRAAKVA